MFKIKDNSNYKQVIIVIVNKLSGG